MTVAERIAELESEARKLRAEMIFERNHELVSLQCDLIERIEERVRELKVYK